MTPQEKQDITKAANYLIGQCVLLGPEYNETMQALIDFLILLNEPQPIINVSENIQQTVNVQEAKNIINDL
jgi:hypothetical protein